MMTPKFLLNSIYENDCCIIQLILSVGGARSCVLPNYSLQHDIVEEGGKMLRKLVDPGAWGGGLAAAYLAIMYAS